MIISVTGGKGGTGKSTVATNLAVLLKGFTLVDLDVEMPNDYILLGEKLDNKKPIKLFKPRFNLSYCIKCQKCAEACHDNAIIIKKDGYPHLIDNLCSGCRACKLTCPIDKAIDKDERLVGYSYLTQTRYGFKLITGELLEGEARTYKVVLKTKGRAIKEGGKNLLIDTGAGAGNSVLKSLEGSKITIAVTEPTAFGLRDLEQILKITKHLSIKTWIVINRSGIADEKPIYDLASRYRAEVIAKIPFSKNIVESYVNEKPISLMGKPEAKIFKQVAQKLRRF